MILFRTPVGFLGYRMSDLGKFFIKGGKCHLMSRCIGLVAVFTGFFIGNEQSCCNGFFAHFHCAHLFVIAAGAMTGFTANAFSHVIIFLDILFCTGRGMASQADLALGRVTLDLGSFGFFLGGIAFQRIKSLGMGRFGPDLKLSAAFIRIMAGFALFCTNIFKI
jgi:hypothetical protein